MGADVDYVTDVLPALVVFSVGLSATVAPLTATVLADADEAHAGIASGVNNAIARAAGLLGVAALGAVVAAQFSGRWRRGIDAPRSPGGRGRRRTRRRARTLARADVSGLPAAEAREVAQATEAAAVSAFQPAWGSAPRSSRSAACSASRSCAPAREVACAGCPGGQLVGAPLDAARERAPVAVPA